MKIAVSSSDGSVNGQVFPVLGRCPFFTIVTTNGKTMQSSSMANPGSRAGGGAGIAAAQAIIESGAEAVITGNCGPNALAVLLQAGIRVYSAGGEIEEVVRSLLDGRLQELKAPTNPGHFGMGRGPGRGQGFGGGRR